jgi:hypothetical protein
MNEALAPAQRHERGPQARIEKLPAEYKVVFSLIDFHAPRQSARQTKYDEQKLLDKGRLENGAEELGDLGNIPLCPDTKHQADSRPSGIIEPCPEEPIVSKPGRTMLSGAPYLATHQEASPTHQIRIQYNPGLIENKSSVRITLNASPNRRRCGTPVCAKTWLELT